MITHLLSIQFFDNIAPSGYGVKIAAKEYKMHKFRNFKAQKEQIRHKFVTPRLIPVSYFRGESNHFCIRPRIVFRMRKHKFYNFEAQREQIIGTKFEPRIHLRGCRKYAASTLLVRLQNANYRII